MGVTANDQFKEYYQEKIWNMIPSIYRHKDGIADNPGVLRSIVEVLASQAALLRRSQDKLWDDQFIELCDSWAVPYLADLVGTRLLSDLNKRGRRVDVAKTIYYRRRKGTPRILEELVSDVTSWEGKVSENFLRLIRSRHRLDPFPLPLAGRFSKTQPGGVADLRSPTASEVSDGPFDEYYHTPDYRQHKGALGRYGIPKVALHRYRLRAYRIIGATPFKVNNQQYTFDPSGRDIPLFNRRNRSNNWDEWRSALEWEMPIPIRCRLLGHAEYLISEAAVRALENELGLSSDTVDFLLGLTGWVFHDGQLMLSRLQSMATLAPAIVGTELADPNFFPELLIYTIIEECGKQSLLPNHLIIDANGNIDSQHGAIAVFQSSTNYVFTANQIAAANLISWSLNNAFLNRLFGTSGQRLLAIDAEHGRFQLKDSNLQDICVNYTIGFSGPYGAGTYYRGSVEDSEPTVPEISGGGLISAADIPNDGVAQIDDSKTYSPIPNKIEIINLTLQSANGHRPYLMLTRNLIYKAKANVDSCLVLDGLWYGNESNKQYEVKIRGDFNCVTIRNCALDPGDKQFNVMGQTIYPVNLVIEGTIDELIIHNSILGNISTQGTGLIENICISDSIVQSIDDLVPAIQLSSGRLETYRVTLFGSVECHELYATDSIFLKTTIAQNTQAGCFRFSTAPVKSQLPSPYESYLFEPNRHNWFTSTRYGQPGFAQLKETVPEAIRRGAENRSEMGVFNLLLNPIKQDDLSVKILEYLPFGLISLFINET
jgi:hypothetical protein